MPWPRFLRSLGASNYRWFFLGQSISLTGSWMTTTAAAWLMYRLTDDPRLVGLVGFATQIPALFVAPLAGVWIDRTDRTRLLLLVNALMFVRASVLAAVTLAGVVDAPILLGLCLVQGVVHAVDLPLRQSLAVDLVGDRRLLTNAIALNSTQFNAARVVGPGVAGLVILQFGEGACFALDALSYLPLLFIVLAGRIRVGRPVAKVRPSPWKELGEGLEFVRQRPPYRRLLLLVPVVTLAGWVQGVLAPVLARDVFAGTAATQGLLLSATGVGALVGALHLSLRAGPAGLDRMIGWSALGLGLAQGLIAASGQLALAVPAYALCGCCGVLVMASTNTALQSLVPDDRRGRVMGLFSMGQGFFPIGSLLAGFAASAIGPRATVAAAAVILVTAGLIRLRRPTPVELHFRGGEEDLAGRLP